MAAGVVRKLRWGGERGGKWGTEDNIEPLCWQPCCLLVPRRGSTGRPESGRPRCGRVGSQPLWVAKMIVHFVLPLHGSAGRTAREGCLPAGSTRVLLVFVRLRFARREAY
eukprot:3254986-Prymnesium_polylepis.2